MTVGPGVSPFLSQMTFDRGHRTPQTPCKRIQRFARIRTVQPHHIVMVDGPTHRRGAGQRVQILRIHRHAEFAADGATLALCRPRDDAGDVVFDHRLVQAALAQWTFRTHLGCLIEQETVLLTGRRRCVMAWRFLDQRVLEE